MLTDRDKRNLLVAAQRVHEKLSGFSHARPDFVRVDCPIHGEKYGYCEECCFPKDHPVDAMAQTMCDAGATMSAAYRQVAIDQYLASVRANNAAQEWRNRAIAAEEEIRENGPCEPDSSDNL